MSILHGKECVDPQLFNLTDQTHRIPTCKVKNKQNKKKQSYMAFYSFSQFAILNWYNFNVHLFENGF